MATRLYFHAANSGVSGTLPSTEQSSLTLSKQADAVTVNRSMDTTIGTSETSLSIAQGTGTYYYTKFVSPLIYQTSIAANTWLYRFGAESDDTGNNFPVSGNNIAVRVTAYVWKPSNGTKYANIIDSTSAATVDEGSAGFKLWKVTTFAGSQVTGLTSGDAVIVFEVWFSIAVGTGPSGNCLIYFDGTDDTYGDGAIITSGASFIETPEDLAFSAGQNIERALPTETITVSETSLSKLKGSVKAQSESISVSETINRLTTKQRPLSTETITTSDTVARTVSSGQPNNVEKTITEAQTTVTDTVGRQANKWRTIG